MKRLNNTGSDAKYKEEKEITQAFFFFTTSFVDDFKSYPVFLGTFFLTEQCDLQIQY